MIPELNQNLRRGKAGYEASTLNLSSMPVIVSFLLAWYIHILDFSLVVQIM